MAIPDSIRSVLESVPKVPKVLAKHALTHLIFLLVLRKLENERLKTTPETLPVFLREYFVHKYGLKSLADYHMLELVKSCRVYRRQFEQMTSAEDPNITRGDHTVPWEETRIFLFGRFLDLFPDDDTSFLCSHFQDDGLSIMLDFLGDILELDEGVASLQVLHVCCRPIYIYIYIYI
jgi:hypothetical protein